METVNEARLNRIDKHYNEKYGITPQSENANQNGASAAQRVLRAAYGHLHDVLVLPDADSANLVFPWEDDFNSSALELDDVEAEARENAVELTTDQADYVFEEFLQVFEKACAHASEDSNETSRVYAWLRVSVMPPGFCRWFKRFCNGSMDILCDFHCFQGFQARRCGRGRVLEFARDEVSEQCDYSYLAMLRGEMFVLCLAFSSLSQVNRAGWGQIQSVKHSRDSLREQMKIADEQGFCVEDFERCFTNIAVEVDRLKKFPELFPEFVIPSNFFNWFDIMSEAISNTIWAAEKQEDIQKQFRWYGRSLDRRSLANKVRLPWQRYLHNGAYKAEVGKEVNAVMFPDGTMREPNRRGERSTAQFIDQLTALQSQDGAATQLAAGSLSGQRARNTSASRAKARLHPPQSRTNENVFAYKRHFSSDEAAAAGKSRAKADKKVYIDQVIPPGGENILQYWLMEADRHAQAHDPAHQPRQHASYVAAAGASGGRQIEARGSSTRVLTRFTAAAKQHELGQAATRYGLAAGAARLPLDAVQDVEEVAELLGAFHYDDGYRAGGYFSRNEMTRVQTTIRPEGK